MRRVTKFRVVGSNYDELVAATKRKYKDLYGVDLEELPHDAEFDISENSVSTDGSGEAVKTLWEADVTFRQVEKPRGSSGT